MMKALVLVVVAAGTGALAAFAPVRQGDFTSLDFVLKWLLGGGAAVVAGILLSWLGEVWPAFQNLPPTAKSALMKFMAGALGLGCWAVVTYVPAETLLYLAGPFAAIATAVLAVSGGQVIHAVANYNKDRKTAQSTKFAMTDTGSSSQLQV